MLTLWIHNTPFSLKKLALLYILALVLVLILIQDNQFIVLSFFLGILTSLTAALCFLTYRNGVFVVRKTYTQANYRYQVRDFFSFKDKKQNFREIFLVGYNAIFSKIYFHQKKPWAYFDIIRLIIAKQKKMAKILILGGGGGSVAKTISEQFPRTEITAVEISQEIIEIAKRYFIKNNPRIHFLKEDAFSFLRKNSESFDFILLDVSNNLEMNPQMREPKFLKKIFATGKTIFVNFGVNHDDIIKNTRAYKKHAASIKQHFSLHLFGNNVVGCNIDTSKLRLNFLKLDNL